MFESVLVCVFEMLQNREKKGSKNLRKASLEGMRMKDKKEILR